ncbi:MAG: type II secretion system protein GspL [Desulforhopalus sp.]
MSDALFCLDIHRDVIAALVVDRSTKITIVKGCGVADTADQPFEDALEQIKEQTGFTGGPCHVTIGAELFSFRNVSLPFSDRKKIEQALPFELVDLSPVDIDSLLIDFIVAKSGSKKTNIVAAMISREFLAEHLAFLQTAGMSPDSIGISGLPLALKIAEEGPADNFVLVDIGTRWAGLFIVLNRQVALIRSLGIHPESDTRAVADDAFVQNVTQTVLASQLLDTKNPNYNVYLTGSEPRVNTISPVLSSRLGGVEIGTFQQSGQPFIKIEPERGSPYQPELMDRILAHVFKNGKRSGGFNFRKDDFRKKKSLLEYKSLLLKTVVPLCILLAFFVAYMGYNYSMLSTEQESLRQQINEVFKQTLPEVTRIVNPVQQLQVKNNEIRATYRPGGGSGAVYTIVDLLTELSVRIPATFSVKVVRLVADMDAIRIKAVTGDFNTVDSVQKELEKSPYFRDVTISSANQSTRGDEVNFELKLELAQ